MLYKFKPQVFTSSYSTFITAYTLKMVKSSLILRKIIHTKYMYTYEKDNPITIRENMSTNIQIDSVLYTYIYRESCFISPTPYY